MTETSVIHVIDDDESVRDSLSFLLRSYDFTVRAYASGSEFISRLDDVVSGCVITDVRMPGLDGLQLMQELRARKFLLPVVVMTGHGDIPLAVRAMKLGAREFLEKPFEEEALLSCVQSALSEAPGVHELAEAERARGLLETLTERERQTLDALVSGGSNKTIAFQLGISPRTVEVHRANLMSKMGVSSLSELVKTAILAGR